MSGAIDALPTGRAFVVALALTVGEAIRWAVGPIASPAGFVAEDTDAIRGLFACEIHHLIHPVR